MASAPNLDKEVSAMAQCKLCERKGLFFTVNQDGLCSVCQQVVSNEVSQCARIINDCVRIIDESENMKTRLSRTDLLVEKAEDLMRYENRGIPTIGPLSPSELVSKYKSMRDDIIMESISSEVDKAIEKAKIATTVRTAISQANKALLKIQEACEEISDPSKLEGARSRIKQFTHRTQLDGFLDAARKAEFKGQKKKALDQYQEALYFLRTDDVDDELQAENIAKIEDKISELSQ
jgi:hypothetical protein